ncbi:GDP-Man:Man(3)GlcNAc(2)-PP-Dol alpha-1,2-mannosyltransferase [Podosphaera aphanis]|nr:GDP-Man:Man(3)GlcNAc(2)-PP-Dol alpha-1,2-mannosyltransferase [Podosphaera aphanis]
MIVLIILLAFLPLLLLAGPKLVFLLRKSLGCFLKDKNSYAKAQILRIFEKDEKDWDLSEKTSRDSDEWEKVEEFTSDSTSKVIISNSEWDGIIGFFHPFCNAGGGGERVLWAAIRATQETWPNAKCVIYTGDHDIEKDATLARVKNRFNITLHPPSVNFLHLKTRSWVLASSWPHFTLLGQSLGSLILAWDAFSLLIPDIFVDTMGFAFSLAFSKFLFPMVPVGAYVHYPTISIDMFTSLDVDGSSRGEGVNAGKGVGAIGFAKKIYWKCFAKAYSIVGGTIDIVMANSTWTLDHVTSLWGPWRARLKKPLPVIVYPPVAVTEIEREIEISMATEKRRQPILLYIAQFRPEKNHQLILKSFASFKNKNTFVSREAKLVLIGSVRDDGDSKRIYELRLLANELQIKDSVEFHLDVSWPEIMQWLRKASIGVNGMWNEHFGIGVVEYQAAGLISVVHDSGGPKRDIVTMIDGKQTGFHAGTIHEFAISFESALAMSEEEKFEMRKRARKSAKRFTENEFTAGWTVQMENLVSLQSLSRRLQ